MKKILTVTLLTLFFLSSTSFADNSNLMHQSHEKIRRAESSSSFNGKALRRNNVVQRKCSDRSKQVELHLFSIGSYY